MARMYRPPLHKRILRHWLIRRALTGMVSLAVRGIFASSRITREVSPLAVPYMRGEQAAIYCFWHGRMLLMPLMKPEGRPFRALVSRHGDGALIADMLRWFGVQPVRGSSSKGGSAAMRELLDAVAAGHAIGITPDGPRGPHEQVAMGALWLAAKTGLPIIPATASATRRRHLRSWDAFTIPLPCTRIALHVAAPIWVPADADDAALESARLSLEQTLQQLTQALDAEMDGRA